MFDSGRNKKLFLSSRGRFFFSYLLFLSLARLDIFPNPGVSLIMGTTLSLPLPLIKTFDFILLWCSRGFRGPSIGSFWCRKTPAYRKSVHMFVVVFPVQIKLQQNSSKLFRKKKKHFCTEVFGTAVSRHIWTGILTRIGSNPRQNIRLNVCKSLGLQW